MRTKPQIICVTGGKGGTGKTLVAVNIANMFENDGYKVLLIDGDVENPNTYLLMGGKLENRTEVPFFKPKIIEEKCTKCGLCAKNCATHALLHVKDSYPIPILTVCSGCKLCYKICPEGAIEADSKVIGVTYSTKINNISLLVGELTAGEARSAAVVDALLEQLDEILENNPEEFDVIVLDTAPGAHCDVELLIEKADVVIPVTEPTKFGKLDLIRIIELIELLKKDYKAIVNRSTLLGYKEQFLKELQDQEIEILGDIPLDDNIVKSYCQGIPLMARNSEFSDSNGYKAFQEIFVNLKNWLENHHEKGVPK
ncbi:MAG: P-loop NTPase [Candidatus Lokiarchaeota archaeon]|nr:P-loop NTPase [Candidatus Lokiarchaeota archaeon]MBD3341846.1 P-loop NTPase [Candidatus Lokiarchaeota archaeon]